MEGYFIGGEFLRFNGLLWVRTGVFLLFNRNNLLRGRFLKYFIVQKLTFLIDKLGLNYFILGNLTLLIDKLGLIKNDFLLFFIIFFVNLSKRLALNIIKVVIWILLLIIIVIRSWLSLSGEYFGILDDSPEYLDIFDFFHNAPGVAIDND